MPDADLVPFDYTALDAADAKFLKEKVGCIRLLARQCAENVIHIGQHLCEVRSRIRGRFGEWVEAEFSWAPSSAYRMMDVADKFGTVSQIGNKFDASALYTLSQAKTPPAAREYAVELAKEGEYVSHRLAKDIIKAVQTNPDIKAKDIREYEKERFKDQDDPNAEPEDLFTDYKTLWTAFKKLITSKYMVLVERDTNGIDDRGDVVEQDEETHQYKAHYKITVWDYANAKPVVHSSTTYLESLVVGMTDSHPMRKCNGPCGQVKRLYEDFGSKRKNKFNRSWYCKVCEVQRVKKYKSGERKPVKKAATPPSGRTAPTPESPE